MELQASRFAHPHRRRRRPGTARGPGPPRWDRTLVEPRPAACSTGAFTLARPLGPYTLQAAIAACHARAASFADTDWVADRRALRRARPAQRRHPWSSSNRAVAVLYVDGPEAALAATDPLREDPGSPATTCSARSAETSSPDSAATTRQRRELERAAEIAPTRAGTTAAARPDGGGAGRRQPLTAMGDDGGPTSRGGRRGAAATSSTGPGFEPVRYVVYGAGAVGGVIGGHLHLAGLDTTLVARGEHLAAIRRDGLLLDTPEAAHGSRSRRPGRAAEVDLDRRHRRAPDREVPPDAAALDDLAAHAPPDTPSSPRRTASPTSRRCCAASPRAYAIRVMLPATHLEPGVVVQKCCHHARHPRHRPVPGRRRRDGRARSPATWQGWVRVESRDPTSWPGSTASC